MDLQLAGKTVLVLASSRGLGKASAAAFAKEGADIMITGRSEESLKEAEKELQSLSSRGRVGYYVCDVTKGAEVKALVEYTVEAFGPVDVLVNNAGGPPAGTFDDFDDDDWQQAFDLNLMSFVRATRAVLPSMKESGGGRIVNITSSSMKQTLDNLILSNTFRAGLMGLAKSLSQELAPHGILINSLGPGKIATDRVAEIDGKKAAQMNKSPEEVRRESEAAIPTGRYGQPEEFAAQVVFYGSFANTYVTGQTLLVDGGLIKAL
ncbi:SDR family oxidoreductase [Marinococcus luteus]|uniref:SDR family oxidoreductase n=1 Tax=Marinococcus luteus TaxID=1122204 RepID=UPI002ACCB359|nr:SDR family oxidoreductase [Marinococcus luteus]MDZ5782641.1 SDR family oxidoreductase [Marinococcus luteus]